MKLFGFASILFAGVIGGISGGILLGGYKLHHELKIRNKEMPLVIPDETGDDDGKVEDNGDKRTLCPMSHNFGKLFETDRTFQDLGSRIAH
jgi:hypothetical protein